MNGWLIFLGLVALYLGVVALARRRAGPLPGGFEFNGPFLFWRTQLGKKAIQKVAVYKRLWNVVADGGIILTWIMGALVFLLLLVSLVQYVTAPRLVAENAPSPEMLIGLPGVNPLIPLGYGVLALILALVIHEGSHGVMAYVANLRVKALGLVFFIVPIGAFVEPDDEDLMKATTREKNRVFAAGPTSNIVLAVVAGVILSGAFLGNLAPVNDGEGVVIGTVESGSAADRAGLQPGDILVMVAGQDVVTRQDYTRILENTSEGQTISLAFLRDGERITTEATLGSYHEYISENFPGQATDEMRGRGFLGVSGVGLGGLDSGIREALAHPLSSPANLLFYIGYPFFIFSQGIDILAAPYNELFVVQGPMAALPPAVFFGAATLLYWIMWLNLMLGTFNALPAGPLDGGQMLRASLTERYMRRYKVDRAQIEVERHEMGGLQLKGKDPETQAKLERVHGVVGRTTRALGFFILGLILMPVFAPPIIRLLL